jgi:hypothetical protein
MPALIKGIFNFILRVSLVVTSTSDGRTRDFAGTSSTSSKVIPSPLNFCGSIMQPPFYLEKACPADLFESTLFAAFALRPFTL